MFFNLWNLDVSERNRRPEETVLKDMGPEGNGASILYALWVGYTVGMLVCVLIVYVIG